MGIHPPHTGNPGRQHPEYDRSLVSALVAARSPRLTFGRGAISSHHGLGSVAVVIIGDSSNELEWLETATTALGGDVDYMPVRRIDNRTAEYEIQVALGDRMVDIAHAVNQSAEGDMILAGERTTGQPLADDELRRIVDEGRSIRRRALDRDTQLVEQYVTHHSVDATATAERGADRRRFGELRDEYQLMNGGEPDVWPF